MGYPIFKFIGALAKKKKQHIFGSYGPMMTMACSQSVCFSLSTHRTRQTLVKFLLKLNGDRDPPRVEWVGYLI